jgi:hypothetical protein
VATALLCGAIRPMLRHPTVADSPEIAPMAMTPLQDDNNSDDCGGGEDAKG